MNVVRLKPDTTPYKRKAASPRPLFVQVRLKPDTTSVYCFGSSILIFDSGSTLPSSAADPVG